MGSGNTKKAADKLSGRDKKGKKGGAGHVADVVDLDPDVQRAVDAQGAEGEGEGGEEGGGAVQYDPYEEGDGEYYGEGEDQAGGEYYGEGEGQGEYYGEGEGEGGLPVVAEGEGGAPPGGSEEDGEGGPKKVRFDEHVVVVPEAPPPIPDVGDVDVGGAGVVGPSVDAGGASGESAEGVPLASEAESGKPQQPIEVEVAVGGSDAGSLPLAPGEEFGEEEVEDVSTPGVVVAGSPPGSFRAHSLDEDVAGSVVGTPPRSSHSVTSLAPSTTSSGRLASSSSLTVLTAAIPCPGTVAGSQTTTKLISVECPHQSPRFTFKTVRQKSVPRKFIFFDEMATPFMLMIFEVVAGKFAEARLTPDAYFAHRQGKVEADGAFIEDRQDSPITLPYLATMEAKEYAFRLRYRSQVRNMWVLIVIAGNVAVFVQHMFEGQSQHATLVKQIAFSTKIEET